MSVRLHLVLLLCACVFVRVASADSPRDRHAWAKFGVGSWTKTRVVTEAMNARGEVARTTTTERTITLGAVDTKSYTLETEQAVVVGGKRLTSEKTSIVQGYHGQINGQTVAIKPLSDGHVEVEGRRYPTAIREVVINGGPIKSRSVVHVAKADPGLVLRRETHVTDRAGNPSGYRSMVEVLALDMLHDVLDERKPVSHVRTIESQAQGGRTITLEVSCPDVPGGVVSHTAKTLDANGRVVERSTLRLIDYHVKPKGDPMGRLGWRWRWWVSRRTKCLGHSCGLTRIHTEAYFSEASDSLERVPRRRVWVARANAQ